MTTGILTRIYPDTEALIRRKRPAALADGLTYAVNALVYEALGEAAPATPQERMRTGGGRGGRALTGEAKARNRHGSKLKKKPK